VKSIFNILEYAEEIHNKSNGKEEIPIFGVCFGIQAFAA